MTSNERIVNTFLGKRVDRIPVCEDFWGETIEKWVAEGHMKPGEKPWQHFDFDMERSGLVNWYADPYFGQKVIDETETTVRFLDGNGATLRLLKNQAGGVEHCAFEVDSKEKWDEKVAPNIAYVNEDRIPFQEYRELKNGLEKADKTLFADAFGPFELLQRLMGHEELLAMMALEPESVKEMVMAYCKFNVMHWDRLFEKEGVPFGMWIAEDLGYKGTAFMSNSMLDEIYCPGYRYMFDYLHSKGVYVLMHSCGYVEKVLDLLIECGLDGLEAMEYKAGMDLPRIYDKFGDKLVYSGNVDIRVLESNDIGRIKEALDTQIKPVAANGGKYILHSDHSISPLVEYSTFCEYLRIGRELI